MNLADDKRANPEINPNPLDDPRLDSAQSVSDWVEALQARLDAQNDRGIIHHCRRMESLVLDLCLNWSVDPQHGMLAVWAHDQLRTHPIEELIPLAETHEIEIGADERAAPILLHGPIVAHLLRTVYRFPFENALEAIEYHTTLRPSPTALEQILYIVDKIEPGKKGRNNAELFQVSYRDLTEAALRIAIAGVRWEEGQGQTPHRLTLGFIEWAQHRNRQPA